MAAPTASLHLGQALLDRIAAKGVDIRKVTLHVGAGTFKPVQSEDLEGHVMHAELYDLPAATAAALNAARARRRADLGRGHHGGPGAGDLRGRRAGPLQAASGETRIFIRPGHAWKAVDGLLTNFHWPRSTLFMLVCSLLGAERAQAAYAEAFARELPPVQLRRCHADHPVGTGHRPATPCCDAGPSQSASSVSGPSSVGSEGRCGPVRRSSRPAASWLRSPSSRI